MEKEYKTNTTYESLTTIILEAQKLCKDKFSASKFTEVLPWKYSDIGDLLKNKYENKELDRIDNVVSEYSNLLRSNDEVIRSSIVTKIVKKISYSNHEIRKYLELFNLIPSHGGKRVALNGVLGTNYSKEQVALMIELFYDDKANGNAREASRIMKMKWKYDWIEKKPPTNIVFYKVWKKVGLKAGMKNPPPFEKSLQNLEESLTLKSLEKD